MAQIGLYLLLGVTLFQGVLLLNPIPEAEEEWEQFSIMMRSPEYRLPTSTVPRHYELNLTPYFEDVEENINPFTFEGTVNIFISATVEDVTQIVMHCNDLVVSSATVEYTDSNDVVQFIQSSEQNLECEMPFSFLRISTSEPLELNREYTIRMSFTGNIQNNMRGFYRSWYIDSSNTRRWMGTTQFQPGHAREAFPCYDEPGFKATFDITINRESDFSPSISNMPLREFRGLVNGRIAETFYTTPRTSTYLLAFIVSHYRVVESGTNENRPFRIYARDNVGRTGEWSLEVGERLLDAMETYTAFGYYTMAANMDMKQAAIPDFSAGAMENWGLLTYREALILYDPQNSNHFYRQRVANIVSHEIAHMWFGNLVTCAWWDNLWLNEGFARYYQYYLTGSVLPELGYATRFIVEQLQMALASDSVDTAHALTNLDVNNPTQVSNHFSTITYARGASILRMTEHLLGYDTYVRGLRNYLNDRQFDVAEPHHLFNALDEAAEEDDALINYNGMTIDRYFRSWSEKAGHPLLTVNVDQSTGAITVTQARWERDIGISQFNEIWDVPITWTRADDADFDDLKPSQFITEVTTVIDRGTVGLEWVIFNKQATGFYRVNYDDTNWALLTRALRLDVEVIHEYNRAQIIDDLFSLGRAGVLRYERVFNILSFLEFDDQYAPWINAITGFSFLLRRYAHDDLQLARLQGLIVELSAAVTDRLGFVEIEDEPYMDGLLRMYVMEFLCNVGHEECVSVGREYFSNWRNGGFIPANMRPWVYCVGLRYGNVEDFNFFWNRYLQEDLASEQVVMLQVAGCTTDQSSLERFLDAIVANDFTVRPQDYTTALNSAVARNEVNTLRVFSWLQRNVEQTTATLGSVSSPVNLISQRLLNEEDITEFETWLQNNREQIGEGAFNTGTAGITTSRNNLRWSENRMPEVNQFLDIGYVEDEIIDPFPPEVTEEPEVPVTEAPVTDGPTEETDDYTQTTEGPTTTEDPGGAATIALSFFLLTLSLAINMLN